MLLSINIYKRVWSTIPFHIFWPHWAWCHYQYGWHGNKVNGVSETLISNNDLSLFIALWLSSLITMSCSCLKTNFDLSTITLNRSITPSGSNQTRPWNGECQCLSMSAMKKCYISWFYHIFACWMRKKMLFGEQIQVVYCFREQKH